MIKFLIRRVVFMILTMFIVSVVVFALTELAPGNIARNTLGNLITPEQEESFNRQNALDQPAWIRYIRWIMGSDWQASSLIGRPVTRIYDEGNDRYSWWAVDADGNLYQNHTPDNQALFKIVRHPDGSTQEVKLGDDVWTPDAQGQLIYWGVDRDAHAAKWAKGSQLKDWTLRTASGNWLSSPGAAEEYIPLQKGLLRGDPGVSFLTRRPVAETLLRRLANTMILAGLAFAFIMPLALVLGLLAGLNEGKWIDRLLSVGGLVTTATPEFVSGVFLILIFSTWLRLLPGAVVLRSDTALFENPEMLVLPVLTLTLVELGYVLRITRASMVEVMRTNYIRTAVLKGLPRFRIVFKHAVRNALMAPITVIMLHVNWLVGGIVIVESIFGYPGLGSYILGAALFKDIFGIEAATMVLILISVSTQLLADFIYTFLNPRIRYA
jgi:peptide/nickel transport system permease protein